MKGIKTLLLVIAITLLSSCASKKNSKSHLADVKLIRDNITSELNTKPKYIDIHKEQKEMRAVWITTAFNLDWPRKAISNIAEAEYQKQELIKIIEQLKSDGYNTVFFQVRTSLGVCYPSNIEPWAITMVKEGSIPYFDPTDFALKECHKRGIKFHAWFVTYPLGGKKALRLRNKYIDLIGNPSLTVLHNNTWYLDPGNPDARRYLANVIGEAVHKYNFDGVHLDYIRYPENASKFPDQSSYEKYGYGQDINSWRRNNVTETVALIKQTILKERPNVLLSVAPLGKLRKLPIEKVGRKHGWTAYESVMQDPELWAKMRYVDFIVPMMYYKEELFSPFLDDWIQRVGEYCPIVVGLAPYRIVTESNPLWNISDITNQINECREKGVSGVAMFRYQFVSKNYPAIRFAIRKEFNSDIMVPETKGITLTMSSK